MLVGASEYSEVGYVSQSVVRSVGSLFVVGRLAVAPAFLQGRARGHRALVSLSRCCCQASDWPDRLVYCIGLLVLL